MRHLKSTPCLELVKRTRDPVYIFYISFWPAEACLACPWHVVSGLEGYDVALGLDQPLSVHVSYNMTKHFLGRRKRIFANACRARGHSDILDLFAFAVGSQKLGAMTSKAAVFFARRLGNERDTAVFDEVIQVWVASHIYIKGVSLEAS